MNQVGRYQVLEELGRGAMGVVYKALDPAIGRTVAIKTIHLSELSNPDERQRVRERLLREAQSAGVLSHPNIVTIYDVLEQDDYAYIFMEYVNGSSLEKMLRKRSLPDREALLHFLRQIAEALDYAHRKGIIHRDIKPANLIISESGPGAERLAKIADFGVAKFVSHEMTHSGSMIGTPNYMSPEQIQGITIDGRSDQFSLAVVVYELLSGEKPFAAESLPSLFYLICKQDPKPVEQVNTTLGDAVGKVLQRALEKEPEQRFGSCGDFVGALTIALGESPDWCLVPRMAAVADKSAFDATAADIASRRAEQVTRKVNATPAEPPIPRPVPPPAYELPALTRRRRGEEDEDLEEPSEGTSLVKKLGLILAMCFAIGAAIVLIVKWNSGPAVPVQVLDTKSAPMVPPPEPLNIPKERPKPASQAVEKPTAPKRAENVAPSFANAGRGPAEVELLSEPPGAKIVVDDKPDLTCNAPCTLSLEGGRHTLTAELNGYTIARRIFNVPDDNSLFIPMTKSMGVILLTSSPSGCSIFVDGKASGHTPATLHLAAGAHRIAVGNGYRQHEETIEVQTDGFEARSFPCQ